MSHHPFHHLRRRFGQSSDERRHHDPVTVAICGNPNCGKTTIFNALTGLRQRVGNYPGVTVEKTTGSFRAPEDPDLEFTLLDIPGSYSLAAFSPDEYVAVQALSGRTDDGKRPDIIACVIDATNLERGLYLLFQVMQVGRPVVVVLNMMDVAERRGLRIDTARLSRLLGDVPVVPVVGSKGIGIDHLRATLVALRGAHHRSMLRVYDDRIERVLYHLCGHRHEHDHHRSHRHHDRPRFGRRHDRHRRRSECIRMLLDQGGPAEREFRRSATDEEIRLLEECRRDLVAKYGALSAAETVPLSTRAAEIMREVTNREPREHRSGTERIDRFLLHPVLGPLVLLAIMVMVFQSIFSWAAPVMGWIDGAFGTLAAWVSSIMPTGPLQSLLADGIVGGVGSVLMFLPQIVILFLFVALLEDSGYMPRAAFLVDRLFGWCGLSGKSFIPMLSSFACAVPGIMASRTIENRRLRILTIMISPLMSCSARLPVYTIMIAAFIPHRVYLGLFNSQGLVLTGLYALGLVLAVVVSLAVKQFVLKRERVTFIMEMPPYHRPSPRSIGIQIFTRAQAFLLRAGTVILAMTIVIWALSYFPRSSEITAEYDRRVAEETAAHDVRQIPLPPEAVAQIDVTRQHLDAQLEARLAELEREREGAYLRDSYFGRIGRAVAPLFAPLGWDWKVTMATLAAFPAREVVVSTLGIVYNLGTDHGSGATPLIDKMRADRWDSGPRIGLPIFTPAVALSVMVFFALCAQCGATLVTIKAETGGWRYAVLAFGYMTTLAYVGALIVFQVARGAGL